MKKINIPSVESILNMIIDAIIVIDDRGIIQSANPAVKKIFDYMPAELIGRNVSILMPDPYSREHNAYLQNYIRTGRAKVIGIGREAVGRKKNGSVFPIYLGVSEVRKEDNKRFFTGVIRDITEVKHYQEDLKRQGDFTAAVLNTARSLVLVLDLRGRIISFNRACEDTTGYSFQEVAGKPFWDFFLAPEERDTVTKNFLISGAKINTFESVWLTKKGDRRLIAWSNSLLFDKDSYPEYVISTGIDITERRELERTVLEITKKEQQRLGQELHDGIAQHLASTAIAAKVLEQKLTRQSSPAAAELKKVVGLLNQAVMQTRELAQGLYAAEMHSDDFVSSLKKLARETEKTLDIRCTAETGGVNIPDDSVSTHLYRIAREAVGNAVKHGHSKNILIRLRKKNRREAELSIKSDGRKFIKPRQHTGLGLRIMRSRAAMLKGTIKISPGSRGGAVVSCIFPLP